eukprot:CAMPEP_0206474470 /NCGR_PEP_ID=MMETSP0324_2-20121206/33502_1 /ASSEMBLY_ACC=CAM_ASM_000836 /TAXON_ID=2866 /ORGANISM="Crypthecodinium cohnii, Strain Seligo" /LENGTH=413 /DNA_ID=CAMNT_0053949641 /DNA_START=96 /DNA_END=1337 /DNA_ORIENTATION=-
MPPANQVQLHEGQSSSEDTSSGSESNENGDHPLQEQRVHSQLSAVERAKKSFSRPPVWMLIAGSLLAICAGMVNSSALLETGAVVSHMTGHLTAVGLRLEGVRMHIDESRDFGNFADSTLTLETQEKHIEAVWKAAMIIASFIFGSFLCGLIIPKNAVNFGGKSFYGVALIANCIFCYLGCFLSLSGLLWPAMSCLAVGCGLQNAMCTMHLGAVVRTTHVTGTSTDIGSTMGRATMILLRGRCKRRNLSRLDETELDVDLDKLSVLMTLFVSFMVGCYLGAFFYSRCGAYTFLIPGSITGTLGILYGCFREGLKRKFKKWKVERLRGELEVVDEVYEHQHTPRHSQRIPADKGGEEDEEEIDEALERLHSIQHEFYDWCEEREVWYHTTHPQSERPTRAATHPSHRVETGIPE